MIDNKIGLAEWPLSARQQFFHQIIIFQIVDREGWSKYKLVIPLYTVCLSKRHGEDEPKDKLHGDNFV